MNKWKNNCNIDLEFNMALRHLYYSSNINWYCYKNNCNYFNGAKTNYYNLWFGIKGLIPNMIGLISFEHPESVKIESRIFSFMDRSETKAIVKNDIGRLSIASCNREDLTLFEYIDILIFVKKIITEN